MLFRFEKPEGFTYKAGQNSDFTLIDPPETDPEGSKRTFSLVTTPAEDHLAITTRMRDTAFKRTLRVMEAGTKLTIEGPYGDLTLHENVARPAVFLAGGIGITPFHSMVQDATERALPHAITLFYSNRRPEDAAFLQELMDLPKKNPHFTFVGTMTDMEKSAQQWSGERGYIDAPMLAKYVSQADMPIYYLAGPLAMVAALRAMLNGSGVSNDDIRTEEFVGY